VWCPFHRTRADDFERYKQIAARLKAAGLNAWAERIGSRMICILMPDAPTGALWFWGVANETWSGRLQTEEGDQLLSVGTNFSHGVDVATIASAIEQLMRAGGHGTLLGL
jgi:hypothetical protein